MTRGPHGPQGPICSFYNLLGTLNTWLVQWKWDCQAVRCSKFLPLFKVQMRLLSPSLQREPLVGLRDSFCSPCGQGTGGRREEETGDESVLAPLANVSSRRACPLSTWVATVPQCLARCYYSSNNSIWEMFIEWFNKLSNKCMNGCLDPS